MVRKMLFNIRKMKARNQGQGLLEFALALPFLMVVVFGVFDLGRVYFSTIILTSAAREGARYLSVNPDDVPYFNNTRVVTDLEARNSGIDLNNVDISCTNGGVDDDDVSRCDSGEGAVVSVTHGFELVLGWLLPSPITISRTAQMVVP
jgi:Flp pilus assembly protein TadG